MRRRCRLCKKSVVDDSIFCQDHRAQAAMFSASFGPGGAASEESPEASGDEPSQSEQPSGTESDGAPTAPTAAPSVTTTQRRRRQMSGPFKAQRPEPEPEEEPLPADPFAAAVVRVLRDLRKRAALVEPGDGAASRWPQISAYTVRDRIMARPYFSIVPTFEGEGGAPFEIGDEVITQALGEGGVVFERFKSLFEENRDRLRARSLQTLNVHLATYAGIIAINELLPNQHEQNLAAFEVADGKVRSVELDDVRDRLHHERW